MSKKLLLADDSITIQKVIQITFAHEDYELTITDNGDAALAKAQEIKPDLVMADVYMPGKNGYELTTAIRQDPALQNIPVLLLAGSFEPFDEDKAKSCQANAWIEKPFESQSLIDRVAELLSAAPAAEAPVAAPVAAPETPVVEVAAAPAAEPAAAPEDPFGDISFEEEPVAAPAVEAAPAEVADDDWSDVSAEAPAEEVAFVEEPVAEVEDDFSFAEEEPVADVEDDFSFADEIPAEEVAVAEPVAEAEAFEMGEDEIMPLDDDDILGAEDLEPAPAEQTLASWSRDDAADDVFSEPLTETPFAEEDVFAEEPPATAAPVAEELPAVAEESQVVFDGPFADEPDVFAEPEPTAVVEEVAEPVAHAEPEPAAVAVPLGDVEEKAASLSEEDIEQIIEKVVTKVVEKLAGTILERVAWEVVPDMAENLIKEEIRKIKDAAA